MVGFLQTLDLMEHRKILIRGLISHPEYLHLPSEARLRLIRKLEKGLEVSAALLHLKAFKWLKTGKMEEDHGQSRPTA